MRSRHLLLPAVLALLASCSDDESPPTDAPAGCGDCDAPIDANELCHACTADQVCVQYFDGTCGIFRTECAPRVPECPSGTACTEGCNDFQCNRAMTQPQLTCHSGGCPGELPEALHCYGP